MSYVYLSVAIAFGIVLSDWLSALSGILITWGYLKKNGPKLQAQEAELYKRLQKFVEGGPSPLMQLPTKEKLN